MKRISFRKSVQFDTRCVQRWVHVLTYHCNVMLNSIFKDRIPHDLGIVLSCKSINTDKYFWATWAKHLDAVYYFVNFVKLGTHHHWCKFSCSEIDIACFWWNNMLTWRKQQLTSNFVFVYERGFVCDKQLLHKMQIVVESYLSY